MQFPALVDLTCAQVTELARDYMSSTELGPRERARIEQHLHACPWCMTYLQQLTQAARASRRLARNAEPPELAHVLALFRSAMNSGALSESSEAHQSVALPQAPPACAPSTPARRAFKFLARGAIAPISGIAWPQPADAQPGVWIEVSDPLVPCSVGVHACAKGELAHWLHDELWLIELGGEITHGVDALVAARGRLVSEVRGWSSGGALRFAQAAFDHASALVGACTGDSARDARKCLASAARHIPRDNVALTAYCAAMGVARLAGVTHFDSQAYEEERRWQSDYIARDLSLSALLSA